MLARDRLQLSLRQGLVLCWLGLNSNFKLNFPDSKESGCETSTGVILGLWNQNSIEEVLWSQGITGVCYQEKDPCLPFPGFWWFIWSGTETQSISAFWVWQTDVSSWKQHQNLEKCKWCRGKECTESVLPPSLCSPVHKHCTGLIFGGWGGAAHCIWKADLLFRSAKNLQVC